MKTKRFVQLGLLMLGAACSLAQTTPPPPPASRLPAAPIIAPGITNQVEAILHSLSMSNKAVLIVSGLRGIEASGVKLKFSDSMSGRFEIQVDGAKDLQREAELLSKDFGTNIAVIVDEATSDGRFRTNFVFRNGSMRRTVAPVGNIALPPGGRRMYVWPETRRLSPPKNVTLVQTD